MNREPLKKLLKRALEVIDRSEVYAENEDNAFALCKEIETYLTQPEPEPVAWMNKDGWIGLYKQGDANIPLYTSQPDQSARVAELERQLREETESHTYVLEQYKLKLATLQAKLEGGVRVEVYRDRFGELRAHQMKTDAGCDGTLIIDDGVEI